MRRSGCWRRRRSRRRSPLSASMPAARRRPGGEGRTGEARDAARLADGKPDLQGTYDLATLTPVERAGGHAAGPHRRAGGEARAEGRRARERRAARRSRATATRRRSAATDRPAPPATSAATTTSGSIRDRAIRSSTDSKRASIVIDPPDGRMPAVTPRGAAAHRAQRAADLGSDRRARTTRASKAAAPTTIPSAGRSASAA